MFPDKHMEALEKKRKNREKVYQAIGLSSFLSSLFIIGPLIHEFGHILPLIVYECGFNLDLNFGVWQGLHGAVQPLCYLEDTKRLAFYVGGHVAVLLVSALFLLKYELKNSVLTGLTGTGLLLSVIFALGSHGDIYQAIEILGINESFYNIITLLLLLGVSATCLRVWERLLNEDN